MYPSTSKYGSWSNAEAPPGPRPLPDAPTDAQPGSEEKIRILTERAAAGTQLFHPQDNRAQKAD